MSPELEDTAGPNQPAGGVVGYTIKELLAQQQQVLNVNQQQAMQKLDRIEAKLEVIANTKAEKTQVDDHERRLLHFEKQEAQAQELVSDFRLFREKVNRLESDSATKIAVDAARRKGWLGVVIGAGSGLAGFANFLILLSKHLH